MKLVLHEPESRALVAAIPEGANVVTSIVSIAEVSRALRVAGLVGEVEADEIATVLDGVSFVGADLEIGRAAAGYAAKNLRPLDALQLATAITVAPDVMLVYDRRLAAVAAATGILVDAPGA